MTVLDGAGNGNAVAAIITATIEVVGRRGYHDAPIAEIAARAGVCLATLHHLYPSREECFLAAYRQTSDQLTTIALDAFAAETEWIDALNAGLRALLEAAAGDPARARVCFVEVQAAGFRAAVLRDETIGRLQTMLDAAPMTAGRERWTLLTRSLIGGIDYIIQRRLVAGKAAELPGLTDDLTTLVATPLLGQAPDLWPPDGGGSS